MKLWIYMRSVFSKLPLLAVALPASYGVAMFSSNVYVYPVNIALGVAFESIYIGAILLAERKSKIIFLATVAMACIASATYNVLYAAEVSHILLANGTLLQWCVAVVHGLPLPVLSVFFAWLLHFESDAGVVTVNSDIGTSNNDALLIEQLRDEIARISDNARNRANEYNVQINQLVRQVTQLDNENESFMAAALTAREESDQKIAELEGLLSAYQGSNNNTPALHILPSSGTIKESAVHLYSTQEGHSIRSLATKFNVSTRTMQGWLQGVTKYNKTG